MPATPAATARLDPSGYVKGWAVEEAAWRLDDAGARDYLINAGGDVVARGEATPGHRWRVGIRHPDEPDKVAAVLAVRDGAVATSGTYERGDHIVDPRTGQPARGLRSLTVVGPRLGFVDAYATAAFVMGLAGLRWVVDPSRPRGARHHRRRPPGLDGRPGALPGLGDRRSDRPGLTAVARQADGEGRPAASVGWRRRSGRRAARRSTGAIARPSPVPPPGAPGAR